MKTPSDGKLRAICTVAAVFDYTAQWRVRL